MITERQEQIENGIEVLERAMQHFTCDHFDLADQLAIRILRARITDLALSRES